MRWCNYPVVNVRTLESTTVEPEAVEPASLPDGEMSQSGLQSSMAA